MEPGHRQSGGIDRWGSEFFLSLACDVNKKTRTKAIKLKKKKKKSNSQKQKKRAATRHPKLIVITTHSVCFLFFRVQNDIKKKSSQFKVAFTNRPHSHFQSACLPACLSVCLSRSVCPALPICLSVLPHLSLSLSLCVFLTFCFSLFPCARSSLSVANSQILMLGYPPDRSIRILDAFTYEEHFSAVLVTI